METEWIWSHLGSLYWENFLETWFPKLQWLNPWVYSIDWGSVFCPPPLLKTYHYCTVFDLEIQWCKSIVGRTLKTLDSAINTLGRHLIMHVSVAIQGGVEVASLQGTSPMCLSQGSCHKSAKGDLILSSFAWNVVAKCQLLFPAPCLGHWVNPPG